MLLSAGLPRTDGFGITQVLRLRQKGGWRRSRSSSLGSECHHHARHGVLVWQPMRWRPSTAANARGRMPASEPGENALFRERARSVRANCLKRVKWVAGAPAVPHRVFSSNPWSYHTAALWDSTRRSRRLLTFARSTILAAGRCPYVRAMPLLQSAPRNLPRMAPKQYCLRHLVKTPRPYPFFICRA